MTTPLRKDLRLHRLHESAYPMVGGSWERRPLEAGFTLLEILIATSILTLVITMSLMGAASMSDAASVENSAITKAMDVNQVMEKMADNISQGMPLNLPAAGANTITFVMPVDIDSDGDMVDANLSIEWGYTRAEGSFLDLSNQGPSAATFTMTYQFVKTAEFANEATLSRDVNGDGDQTDVFDIGKIQIVYSGGTSSLSGTVVAALTLDASSAQVIVDKNGATGDLDGDGQADPIFWQNGAILNLTFFQSGLTEDSKYVLIKTTTALGLQNYSVIP